jgi:thiol peroxidase
MTLTGSGTVDVGQPLPAIKVSKSLVEDVSLADYKGKRLIINVIPSIDTGVCQTQTKRFNSELAKLGDDVVVLTVSRDLPVAMSRWCGAEGVNAVQMASDYKHHAFGESFGLIIKELGLLARAVYVVDREGVVRHAEIVKEIASEPNYEAALSVLASIA